MEPLDLVAVRASRTVVLRFREYFVPDERVTGEHPYAEWAARDAANLRLNGSLALGVAARCVALLGSTPLHSAPLRDALDGCRSALDAGTPEARAAAAALAVRAAAALATAHGAGAVLLDAAGEVVRPALIWCDQRTEKQSQELCDKFGREQLIQLTCNPPLTNFTLTKILWVQQNEPEKWARVRHIMLPKDYVRFRLTGDFAIDVADASGTLLLDVAKRTWSSEVLSGTGIDKSFLPALCESPEICGKLNAEGAAATQAVEPRLAQDSGVLPVTTSCGGCRLAARAVA